MGELNSYESLGEKANFEYIEAYKQEMEQSADRSGTNVPLVKHHHNQIHGIRKTNRNLFRFDGHSL